MRALLMGDAHIGKTIRGRSRLDEQRRVLASFVGAVDDHDVDVCVFPGDTFETARPGPEEIRVFADLLSALISRGKQILVTPGNHDGPTTLRALEGKVTSWLGSLPLDGVHALSDPSFTILEVDGIGWGFYSLPYPHKRSLDHLVDRSLRDRTEAVSKALENIIETEQERLHREHPGMPKLFVGHLSVLNAQLSADQAMKLGWDVTIRPEVLVGFRGAFLGHIHRQQPVIDHHSWYSGSPIYGDFGETTQSKGFLLWDSTTDVFTPIQSDHLDFHRFDVHESGGYELDASDEVDDGYVQVRMFPDKGGTPSWASKRALRALFPYASGVWVDVMPRPVVSRARLEPTVRTTDPEDVLQSYIRIHGLPEGALDLGRSIMAAVDDEG